MMSYRSLWWSCMMLQPLVCHASESSTQEIDVVFYPIVVLPSLVFYLLIAYFIFQMRVIRPFMLLLIVLFPPFFVLLLFYVAFLRLFAIVVIDAAINNNELSQPQPQPQSQRV